MIVTRLDEPPQPPTSMALQNIPVNYPQSAFWTTDGYGPEKQLRSAR
jgi:hypothetical protein